MTHLFDSAAHRDPALPDGLDVAVVAVSDRRDRHHPVRRSAWAAMEDYTTLLGERTALRPLPVPLTSARPPTVADRLADLPATVAAALLIGLDPTESAAVQAITDAAHRMRAIDDLERRIGALELPPLGYSTVSEHAEIHVIDAATLAVVMMCAHNVSIVEHAIRAENYDLADISADRDIITVTIRDRACSS